MFFRLGGDLGLFNPLLTFIFMFRGLRILFFEFLDLAEVEPIEDDLNWLFGEPTPCVFFVFLVKQKKSSSVSSTICFDLDFFSSLFLLLPI